MKETEYELLVAIANQGCIDTVMDVARSVGAGGGTVIHAKGTGMETAEKFLGVSLAAEKEIILIVNKKRTEKCNHESHDGADRTCQQRKNNYNFLPVTSTVGLRMYIDEWIWMRKKKTDNSCVMIFNFSYNENENTIIRLK